jgi:hypothetical protein
MNLRMLKLAAGAIVLLAIGIATGVHAADDGGQQVEQGAASIRPVTVQARGITAVAVTNSAPNSTVASTTTLTLLPGMTLRVTNPGPGNQLLLARFSAESACYSSSTASNWCVAEILVDGVEASPGDGTDMAFDSTESGHALSTSWEAHAMDRAAIIAPGVHVVSVYGRTLSPGATFWTGERSLIVEQAPV